jgi:hypothetical protein
MNDDGTFSDKKEAIFFYVAALYQARKSVPPQTKGFEFIVQGFCNKAIMESEFLNKSEPPTETMMGVEFKVDPSLGDNEIRLELRCQI